MYRTRKSVLIPFITGLSLLLLSSPVNANTETPQITIIKAETIPGTVTRMLIEWDYAGAQVEGLQFRLTGPTGETKEESPLEILDGTARVYMDNVLPGKPSVDYILEAAVDDSVTASVAFKGLIAQLYGFESVEANDAPYDAGGVIHIRWQLKDKVKGKVGDTRKILIYRNKPGDGGWELVGSADAADGFYEDSGLKNHQPYNYLLEARGPEAIYTSKPMTELTCHAAWFDMGKINLLVIMIIVLSAVTYYVLVAGKKPMYVRKIAGIEAVEEAVGRATEMGRSILFIPGIRDLDDVQTIAGLTILGSIAKLAAQYETKINVPVCTSMVMSNGREVVKEAFLSVGRPDLYNDDIVHYITDEQFGYVAAVDGIMVRDKPATCFYMGAFFAESLILAETGNYVGAIQIAGTAMPTQLPFFVAACDYTLIGEELFAASAYLSGDQRQIASLRGQDIGKMLAMGAIALGSIFITLASFTGEGSLMWKLSDMFARLFAMNY